MEYKAKCPKCSQTYFSDLRWQVCPVCAVDLEQLDRRRCQPVPKAPKASGMAYTVPEVAEMMGFSRQTITRMFEKEPGVIILNRPERMHKRRSRAIRIPRPVYERVRRRLEV